MGVNVGVGIIIDIVGLNEDIGGVINEGLELIIGVILMCGVMVGLGIITSDGVAVGTGCGERVGVKDIVFTRQSVPLTFNLPNDFGDNPNSPTPSGLRE